MWCYWWTLTYWRQVHSCKQPHRRILNPSRRCSLEYRRRRCHWWYSWHNFRYIFGTLWLRSFNWQHWRSKPDSYRRTWSYTRCKDQYSSCIWQATQSRHKDHNRHNCEAHSDYLSGYECLHMWCIDANRHSWDNEPNKPHNKRILIQLMLGSRRWGIQWCKYRRLMYCRRGYSFVSIHSNDCLSSIGGSWLSIARIG